MPGRGRPVANPIPAQDKIPTDLGESKVDKTSPSALNVLIFHCSNSIGNNEVEIIEREFKNKYGDTLYLVLNTFGGDIYSAVRIMRIIQHHFKDIKVIVPDYVYSSGTVMALGGNKIYMDIDASLGPLDKPMENPRDGSDISSLDITQTLTNLASTAEAIAGKIYSGLRSDEIKLSKIEAAKLAYETSVDIINPILGKIDPYFLQSGYRQTKIGLNYAIDLLLSRMMKGNAYQAVNSSLKLVNNYPSHGYAIFRDEARNMLSLDVENLENMPEWTKIESIYTSIKNSQNHKIQFMVI